MTHRYMRLSAFQPVSVYVPGSCFVYDLRRAHVFGHLLPGLSHLLLPGFLLGVYFRPFLLMVFLTMRFVIAHSCGGASGQVMDLCSASFASPDCHSVVVEDDPLTAGVPFIPSSATFLTSGLGLWGTCADSVIIGVLLRIDLSSGVRLSGISLQPSITLLYALPQLCRVMCKFTFGTFGTGSDTFIHVLPN